MSYYNENKPVLYVDISPYVFTCKLSQTTIFSFYRWPITVFCVGNLIDHYCRSVVINYSIKLKYFWCSTGKCNRRICMVFTIIAVRIIISDDLILLYMFTVVILPLTCVKYILI